MAKFERLSVQNVRSFGDNVVSALQFEQPLTVILGPNGSGKTTLIECLKYVTTGDMPPGQLRAFIHDPKVASSTRVDASVALEFSDITGKDCTAVRRLSSTMPKNKRQTGPTCKSEEHTLKRGENTMSTKVQDMDREVVNLLGVSKAVLNYVIFCHQEHANWPLGEAKDVKQKFDDIFASTKYIKALDSIKKLRTELAGTIKDIQRDLKSAKETKVYKNEVVTDKGRAEQELAVCDRRVVEIGVEMKPVDNETKQLESDMANLQQLETRLSVARTELRNAEERADELRGAVAEPFVGSRADLLADVDALRRGADDSARQRLALERQVAAIDQDISEARASLATLGKQVGGLEVDAQNEESCAARRLDQVRRLVQAHDVRGYSHSTLNERDLDRFTEALHKKIGDMRDELTALTLEFERKEDVATEERNRAQEAVATTAAEQTMQTRAADVSDAEAADCDRQLGTIRSSQSRLLELDRQIARQKGALSDTRARLDEDSVANELVALRRRRDDAESKASAMQDELKAAQADSDARNKLTFLEGERGDKQVQLKHLHERHRSFFDGIFKGRLDSELRDVLDGELESVARRAADVDASLQAARLGANTSEQQRLALQAELSSRQAQLADIEQRLLKAAGGDSLDAKLNDVEASLKKLRFDKGVKEGAQQVFNDYIGKLKEKPCCPLCQRDYADENAAKGLVTELNRQLKRLPSEVTALEKKLIKLEDERSVLLELKPAAATADSLRNDIPQSQRRVETLQRQVTQQNRDVGKMESELEELRASEALLREVHGDVGAFENTAIELQRLDDSIGQLRSTVSASTRSVALVQADLEAATATRRDCDKQLGGVQDRLNDHRKSVASLSSELNTLEGERLDLSKLSQQTENLKLRMSTAQTRAADCRRAAEAAAADLASLQRQLSSRRDQVQRIVSERQVALDAKRTQQNELQRGVDTLEQLNAEMARLVVKGTAAALRRCAEERARLDGEEAAARGRRADADTRLRAVTDAIDSRALKERCMKDQLDLIDAEGRVEKQRKAVREQESVQGAVSLEQLQRKYSALSSKWTALERDMAQCKGEAIAKKQLIDELRVKLNNATLANVEREVTKKTIELVTTKEANKDLLKYYSALDKAIIQFHSDKMKQINTLLREYWQRVYRGSDIDYIEIQSDESDVSTEKRRVYNYRVVMAVDGKQLDMRNRCSAGQKVLASILIRLALAEVFCLNCGMLALDEPTTNLDRAKALIEMVCQRKQQRNFQLVVITHDERFVDHMLRCFPVERFYSVGKDEHGHSRLRAHTDIADIAR